MDIKKALFPYIPTPALHIYQRIKRSLSPKTRNYSKTGNNIAHGEIIPLDLVLIKKEGIDSVKIIQYLEWDNPFNCNDFGRYQYQETYYKLCGETELPIEFSGYGLWTIEIHYCCKGKTFYKEKKTIKVEAPVYNIAYLSATLPVVLFLLDMWEISKENSPTIISLERNLFDYNKLPPNVYPFPLANKMELNTPYKGFNTYFQRMVFYIGSLYRMNPDAKFNLYLCDHFAYLVLCFLYANKIPEENFHVFLLSDGIGSYECFNYIFKRNNAIKIYGKMKKTWKKSKRIAFQTGVQNRGKEKFLRCGNPCMSKTIRSKSETIKFSYGFSFAYVLAAENKNIEWLLHNPKLLNGNKEILSFLEDSRIRKIDFNKKIKALESNRDELARLLGINCSIFEKSKSENKKVCVILGSALWSLESEKYINATIEYFGDDYDYYFKGHPRHPFNPQKKQMLVEKGIHILDSKIPTEFYMMINPDIYLAGYLSSAFLSIELLRNPSEQVLSIWDGKECKIKTNCFDFNAKTAMYIENGSVVIVTNDERVLA